MPDGERRVRCDYAVVWWCISVRGGLDTREV